MSNLDSFWLKAIWFQYIFKFRNSAYWNGNFNRKQTAVYKCLIKKIKGALFIKHFLVLYVYKFFLYFRASIYFIIYMSI